LRDSSSSVMNFADLKPTTYATISMSCAFDWDRSITDSFIFFHGRTVSVLAHGLTKEAAVPAAEIKQAIIRKIAFSTNPVAHTYKGEINDV